jgi:hypothetical protein
MEEIPLCPLWWPEALWNLHFAFIPFKRPGIGPVNRPADVDALLASLQAHTASYLMGDEKLASQIRFAAIANMKEMIKRLEEDTEK